MKVRRIVFGVLVALALLGYVVARGAARANDFKYPYNVARHVWKTGTLKVSSQPRYPVTFHVLLAPIASLPIGQAAAVWALLSFAAVAALPWALARLSGIAPRRQWLAWLVVAPCLVDALVLGQGDPINLLLVTAGLVAVKERRPIAGTGLIGIAAMIKFLPAIFWVTAVSRSRGWRAWAGIGLASAAGLALVASAVGRDAAIAGFVEQYELIRDFEKPWQLVARGSDLRPNNESLPIVLARTFGALGPKAGRPSPSLARCPLPVIWAVWGTGLAVLGGVSLASLGPAAVVGPERGWLGMFALTAIAMLAATPICWHHYFLWTLPAVLFLIERRRIVVAVGALAWLGTTSQLARGFGCHMALALFLFAAVACELRRSAIAAKQTNPARRQARKATAAAWT